MTFRKFLQSWDRFWFEPQPATAMGLYRILFGLTMMQFCLLMAPDLLNWYGTHGTITPATARLSTKVICVNFLAYPPFQEDQWVVAFFALFCVASLLVTFGLFTRVAVFIAWLGFAAFHHRNLYNINSGDVLMNLSAFYLFFSPAGEAFSLDRLVRVWLSRDADEHTSRLFSPWAQRLMQLQMAAIYCQATLSKLAGEPWVNGTALYWVLRQREFARFPLPIIPDNLFLCRIMSWFTLVIEGSMWTLVWFRDLRYWCIAGAILLHLGIDYAMNLPMFETLMIFSMIVFVYPEDLSRTMDWVKLKVNGKKFEQVQLIYDGASLKSRRVAETIRRLDIFGRINLIDFRETKHFKGKTGFKEADAQGTVAYFAKDKWLTGGAAFGAIARRLLLP